MFLGMATTPWLASGLLACLAVPPVLGQMTVFDVRDLLVDQEGRWPVQLQDWHGRRNVLTELADAGFRRKNKDWSVTSEDQGYVMVRGGKEATREFMAMMTDLRRGNVRAVELQIAAMEVGKGVVVTRIQGEQASLLWVRLTTATEPAKDPVSGVDPGGKK
jgi:hypothetical protein